MLNNLMLSSMKVVMPNLKILNTNPNNITDYLQIYLNHKQIQSSMRLMELKFNKCWIRFSFKNKFHKILNIKWNFI